MIFGFVSVNGHAVKTHRDSYLIKNLSVVSVRRPLLAPAFLFGLGFGGFGWSFSDLLEAGEIATIIGVSTAGILAGVWLGQLKLLSRDLRGSELSGVIWGGYARLNKTRSEIVTTLDHTHRGVQP